jgi:hypothetical protein
MDNRTLSYLLFVVVAVMAIMVFLNFLGFWETSFPEKYISKNDVRGIDVEHKGKLWTLNFDQQNELINALNASIVTNENVVPVKMEVDKIIIYQFNKRDIIITPLNVINGKLVFQAPEWTPQGNYLMEIKTGGIQYILSQTYDH